ncbi:ZIP family metal transporter [Conexibacter sp. SYSU D00693]|uniref:ZIP family metal transporter n=1 Tax=Conexibacter sp. SYSU D00693 TaxID=2812560 RepID=UPI00196B8EA5|nr:ZIP family metal transporter [Conexibacter sp. SYSU D00693]
MEVLLLALAALGTAVATGLGAVPVLALGDRVARWAGPLWALAGGVMVLAAVFGLVGPELGHGHREEVAAGTAAGALALAAVRRRLARRSDAVRDGAARRRLLVAATMTAHSLPEGLALGAAWAQGGALGALVVLAIALQNVPEGLVVALPMRDGGAGRWRTVAAAIATSLPQVPGALAAYVAVELADRVQPVASGLAAGAMLALVVLEVAPAASASLRSAVPRAARMARRGADRSVALHHDPRRTRRQQHP